MGLLAGGAARAPRAQAVAALGLGGAGERRHDDAAKRVEHRAVAGEGRDGHGRDGAQVRPLVGVGEQARAVGAEVVEPESPTRARRRRQTWRRTLR